MGSQRPARGNGEPRAGSASHEPAFSRTAPPIARKEASHVHGAYAPAAQCAHPECRHDGVANWVLGAARALVPIPRTDHRRRPARRGCGRLQGELSQGDGHGIRRLRPALCRQVVRHRLFKRRVGAPARTGFRCPLRKRSTARRQGMVRLNPKTSGIPSIRIITCRWCSCCRRKRKENWSRGWAKLPTSTCIFSAGENCPACFRAAEWPGAG